MSRISLTKPSRHPSTPCRCCGGTGQIELTGIYFDTLKVLRGLGEFSGADLARYMDVPATAMNNRLARLEELGFATSRRYGRQRLFKAT